MVFAGRLLSSADSRMKLNCEPTQVPTSRPVCTGSSVLGIVFNGGVAIAADSLVSYGKLARYKNVSRLLKLNENVLIGIGGDYADYQFIENRLLSKQTEDSCMDPGHVFGPQAIFSWLTNVLYSRRSKLSPLWNIYVVGGINRLTNEPFLGAVNYLGVAYRNPYIATGIGTYFVQQTLENIYKEKNELTEKDAMAVLEHCMEILFQRDCLAYNNYEVGIATATECKIVKPEPVVGRWEIAPMVNDTVWMDGKRVILRDSPHLSLQISALYRLNESYMPEDEAFPGIVYLIIDVDKPRHRI